MEREKLLQNQKLAKSRELLTNFYQVVFMTGRIVKLTLHSLDVF